MWILPSLGRPEKLQGLADLIPDSKLFVYLHKGDERLEDYMAHQYPKGWTINVGERRNLCDTLNWFVSHFPNASCYGLMADDVIPSPPDWQSQLEFAAGSNYLAYPDDGLHGVNLCPHHCIGGDLMRRVGYWAAPGLKHSFLDTAWYQMAGAVGALRFLPYIMFDHQHPYAEKGEMDATYEIGASFYEEDMQVFQEWQYDGFAEAVDRINAD
jgi:hypothetical protein